ncbi:TPA: threonine synthase [Candidatus Woesearchaeota archaeon]|nr:threonine synthase [Candidatus Woesearchaeota archaeon]HII69166.1 threonine synthase [Candidatus Woesearchaeota archaeon]
MRTVLRGIESKTVYPAKEQRYRGENGELLEVVSDLTSFNRSPAAWKEHFDEQKEKPAFIRYKDVLLPDLPEKCITSLSEGDTPLYPATKAMRDYFGVEKLELKHEGMNPTLSFKDRGMVAGVSWARFIGADVVACASTGDTSAAMAAYAACAGIKAVVLLPEGNISFEQYSQPIAAGAITLGLDTDFDGCMELIQKITAKHRGIYLLNSMNSFRIEGQKAIGIEALHQRNWQVPDWFIIPVGNAGNVSALAKGIRELYELGIINRLPRIAGVQTKAASPLYNSYKNGWAGLVPITAKKTKASAIQIGNPVSFKKAVRELKAFNGVVEAASEEEIMDAKAVVDASGISICPNSATAMAGLRKLAKAGIIRKTDSVVAILTAHGAKFSQATVEYHRAANRFANKPKALRADVAAIEKALGL